MNCLCGTKASTVASAQSSLTLNSYGNLILFYTTGLFSFVLATRSRLGARERGGGRERERGGRCDRGKGAERPKKDRYIGELADSWK